MKKLALLLAVLIGGLAVAGGVMWQASGPGATSFAGNDQVTLAAYKGASPTGVPASLNDASLILRGEYLTRAADCAACHTAPGGAAFAGGRAFVLPFGTVYSPNITPDKDTGIGDWTNAQFLRALHRGIDDEGARIYPVMPYTNYTLMSDADVLAIRAYLFSLKPVHAVVPDDALKFPYNQRWLMIGWSALFNPDHRFMPHANQSPQWNRGAYLAEALGHCGECHTPRNIFQALDNRRKFAGAVQVGWHAYNITGDHVSGIGGWSRAALATYLANGHATDHGPASGPMAEAVGNSLRYLTADDMAALTDYISTVPPQAGTLPPVKATAAPETYSEGDTGALALGQKIYEGACVSCHAYSGRSQLVPAMTLTGDRAVNDPSGLNVARVVLEGSRVDGAGGQAAMPGFGAAYSNAEIAAVVNYVTTRFGAAPATLQAVDIGRLREAK